MSVEKLLPIERDWFLWLNGNHNAFWDVFMSMYTNKVTWIPLALILLIVLTYKVEWKQIVLFIGCGLLIGLLCDMFAADVIKPFFSRFRPSHHPDFRDLVHLVDGRRGGRFGFISNHAANGCGIAIFTSLLFRFRWYTITIFSWVLITMYSRIYLGVHFITDILGGAVWGLFVGILIYIFYTYIRKIMFSRNEDKVYTPRLPKERSIYVIYGFLLTVFLIFVYSILKASNF